MKHSLLYILLLLPAGGCVQRTLTIDSDPPGALVYLNNQEVGRTPMTRDFVWYGNYELHLRKEGYQTLKTNARVRPPLWQIPPLDLITELLPFRLRDHKHFSYSLRPVDPVPDDPRPLIGRAERMRGRLEE